MRRAPAPLASTTTARPCSSPASSRLGQELGKHIDHPSAWTADDMKRRQAEWVYVLTTEDVAELDAALAHAEATGKAVEVSQTIRPGWGVGTGRARV